MRSTQRYAKMCESDRDYYKYLDLWESEWAFIQYHPDDDDHDQYYSVRNATGDKVINHVPMFWFHEWMISGEEEHRLLVNTTLRQARNRPLAWIDIPVGAPKHLTPFRLVDKAPQVYVRQFDGERTCAFTSLFKGLFFWR